MKRHLKGYLRITRTIANPAHDGRRRSGIAKFKEFTVGTVLALYEYTFEASPGHSLKEFRFAGEGSHNSFCETDARWKQLTPFEQWTEPTEPTLWQRYREECGHADDYVLRRILEKGLVTWEQVLEIWNEEGRAS